jgi:hypothetical protein
MALMLVCVLPGAFTFWFVIHPFVGFWRRYHLAFVRVPAMFPRLRGT